MTTLQQINKAQLKPHIIDISHIDTTTIGKSLITKIIPGSGLTISNSTGVDTGTGAVTLQLDSTLSSLANLTGIGLVTRLSDDSIITRELTVSNNLLVTNSLGQLGNPTLDLSDTGILAGTYKYITSDIKGRITAGYKYLDHWVANEILTNASGDNTVYTLANTPVSGTLMIFMSGAKQIPGADKDYTVDGTTVTFTTSNLSSDIVAACYFWNSNGINIQDIQTEVLAPFDTNYQRYRLTYLPEINSQVLFVNGLLQRVGDLWDYTMEGQDVVFTSPLDLTDTVSVLYWR